MVPLDLPSMCEQRVQFLVPHNGMASAEQLDAEDMGFTSQEGRFLHMSSSVDMENVVTIGCAGAVLTYLRRRRAPGPSMLDSSSETYQVKSMEMFGLEGTM